MILATENIFAEKLANHSGALYYEIWKNEIYLEEALYCTCVVYILYNVHIRYILLIKMIVHLNTNIN